MTYSKKILLGILAGIFHTLVFSSVVANGTTDASKSDKKELTVNFKPHEFLRNTFEEIHENHKLRISKREIRKTGFIDWEVTVNNFRNIQLASNLEPALINMSIDEESAENIKQKALALHKLVEKQGRITNLLDPSIPLNLPMGISKEVAGTNNVIIIDQMTFTPNGAKLTAYLTSEVPRKEEKIAFKGKDIEFTPKGFEGAATLELVSDENVNIGNDNILTIKGSEGKTYVSWDCNGFREIGLQATLTLNPDIIVPAQGGEGQKVTTQFEAVATGWNDIVAEITIPQFEVKGLDGFIFNVQNAVFDYSDFKNSENIAFPEGYTHPLLLDENSTLWQGIFIREASVTLPDYFKSSSGRPSIAARKLVLDDIGVSGTFTGENLLPLSEGDMSGWAFSLNKISVSLLSNQIDDLSFAGEIQLPIQEEKTALGYSGFVDMGGNYFINVSLQDDEVINIPVWSAQMTLFKNSYLDVKVSNGKFLPKAVLNGNITIKTGGSSKVNIADLTFEEMTIQTTAPNFDVKAFALSSGKQLSMAGFPISLSNIELYKKQQEVVLGFNAALNLVSPDDGGFGADAGFEIVGEMSNISGRTRWTYQETRVSDITIDIDGGAFKLNGSLAIYKNDEVYGNGFKGMIDAYFQPGFNVSATAQFGSVDPVGRYFYADAMLVLPSGIMFMPGFGFYGFGGGIYHHMKRVTGAESLPTEQTTGYDDSPEPGKSLSGVVYVPDKSIKIGLKATVVVGTVPSPKAFNADVTFEMAFNNRGGLSYVGFMGEGYLMTDLNNRSVEAPLYAGVLIEYDVDNKTLFSRLDVHINIAGIVKGTHEQNRAGTAIMYFSPDDWYINVGTPDDRISLEFVGLLQATSYFMVGTNIPGMPPPPAQVSEILGGMDLNCMRDENALGTGNGFAFGSTISMSTGDMKFLIFYASFEAGVGFDIMLKNYGDNVRCEGRSKPLGINGWYASGQAYAYFQGKIGVEVDLRFVKGNYEILSIGAAVVLQAKLPNPTWLHGVVGGYYSVLGGLVKGNCKFEATIGQQCKIVGGNAFSGMKMIAEVTPNSGARDVNVFNAAQAVFNMPVEKSFIFPDVDGTRKSYKLKLNKFAIYNEGKKIEGTLKFNADKDVVVFDPIDVLPGEKEFTAEVEIIFQEYVNGKWNDLKVDGELITEIMESKFRTGPEPDHILPDNVKYSYPIHTMLNFYPEEYQSGYVQLIKGQNKPFELDEGWTFKGRFESVSNNQKHWFNFSYDPGTRKISFNIPAGIERNQIYKVELLKIPPEASIEIDKNVEKISKNSKLSDDQEITITTKDAEGTIDIEQEKTIYDIGIRVSYYSTFKDKITAVTALDDYIYSSGINGVHHIGTFISGNEYFDKFELTGDYDFDPLIYMKINLDNTWYKRSIYPLLYKDYPINSSIIINNRIPEVYGIPPIRNGIISIRPNLQLQLDADLEIFESPYNQIFGGNITSTFALDCYKDFIHLRNKASAYLLYNESNREIEHLLTSPFDPIQPGNYKIELKYTLPGIKHTTSSTNVEIDL